MNKLLFLFLSIPIVYADIDTETLKEKLIICSSSEINVIDILYTGENLDKDCLTKEFNKVFQTQKKIDWLGEKYQVEINDYESNQVIKTITSIWGERCGEKCIPSKDWIIEAGNKFWYLAPYSDGAVDILMYDSKEPLMIKYTLYTSSAARNNIINIPKQKSYSLGSGNTEIIDINLERIKWVNVGRKSYFIDGGAFWYDTISTLNFEDESIEWEWVNAPEAYIDNSCIPKGKFIEMTGMDEKHFANLDEVCYSY